MPTILITGANQGLGLEFTRQTADTSLPVAGHRNQPKLFWHSRAGMQADRCPDGYCQHDGPDRGDYCARQNRQISSRSRGDSAGHNLQSMRDRFKPAISMNQPCWLLQCADIS